MVSKSTQTGNEPLNKEKLSWNVSSFTNYKFQTEERKSQFAVDYKIQIESEEEPQSVSENEEPQEKSQALG